MQGREGLVRAGNGAGCWAAPQPHPGKGGDWGCPEPWEGVGCTCEVLCPGAKRGAGGVGAHGGITQDHWEHWGSPDLPTAVRQGAPGAAAAPFLPPPAPRLSPFPVSGLLLFWVRGQGRAGPAAGNSPARAGAAPGTAEPPRAQPRHRGPATGVPNTPGTARPVPPDAPRSPGASRWGRGVTGPGMGPTEPSGWAGGAGQDLATLPRSGRHRRPIRPGIRPRDLPAGRGRNRPSSCSASGFPCSCAGLETGPRRLPGTPHPIRNSAPPAWAPQPLPETPHPSPGPHTHPMWFVLRLISSSRSTLVDSCTLLLNFWGQSKAELCSPGSPKPSQAPPNPPAPHLPCDTRLQEAAQLLDVGMGWALHLEPLLGGTEGCW